MYLFFPEEQDPMIPSILPKGGENNDVLYIHRNGFNRFADALNNERAKILSTIQKANPEMYNLFLAKKLSLDEADTMIIPDYMIEFSKIISGFSEVTISVNMLHDTQVYLNKLPDPKSTIISRYIRYHLSNHFNEFFILTERMGTLLKTVQKLYQKDMRFHRFSRHFNNMKSILTQDFSVIRRARNYHVHEKRYSDGGLEELESIEFDIYFKISYPEDMIALLTEKIETNRSRWLEKIGSINTNTDEFLDLFFGILHRFLFSEENGFLPPKSDKKKAS